MKLFLYFTLLLTVNIFILHEIIFLVLLNFLLFLPIRILCLRYFDSDSVIFTHIKCWLVKHWLCLFRLRAAAVTWWCWPGRGIRPAPAWLWRTATWRRTSWRSRTWSCWGTRPTPPACRGASQLGFAGGSGWVESSEERSQHVIHKIVRMTLSDCCNQLQQWTFTRLIYTMTQCESLMQRLCCRTVELKCIFKGSQE